MKPIISSEGDIVLKDYAKRFKHGLILFFYPKDLTSGCSQQASDFRDHYDWFLNQGYGVLGVSRDPLSKHQKFIEKFALNFPLLSDEDEALCQAFSVMKEKSMYGRKYMGIERSTFLLNQEAEVIKEWRKVKVAGHVAELKQYLESQHGE